MPQAAVSGLQRASVPPSRNPRELWADTFRAVRAETERRAGPLSAEDQTIQSMPDASPAKWHRAHTTWFFEQFLLKPYAPGYVEFDPRFAFLFNSYYVAAGPRHARPERGLITRPTTAEVAAYRAHVNAAVDRLIRGASSAELGAIVPIVEIGTHHEQQHQELLWTDILHAFAQNPTNPVYDASWRMPPFQTGNASAYADLPAGIHSVGFEGKGFCFDNEQPPHDELLREARIARHLVTNGEWLEFIADGGYSTPGLWLSDGWAKAEAEGWEAPGYWRNIDGHWFSLTLGGLRPVDPAAPVLHVSYYEADAFARWAGNTCQARPNGRLRPGKGSSPMALGWLGNGPGVLIWRIRATAPLRARSASTTASSWSIRWSFADHRWQHRRATNGSATATSSIPRPAGSSAGCGWSTTAETGKKTKQQVQV